MDIPLDTSNPLPNAAAPPSYLANFPIFVGHRRRMLSTDGLFDDACAIHSIAAKEEVREIVRNEGLQLQKEDAVVGNRHIAEYFTHQFECSVCHASLPTGHLLELHIAELHDSFFAAQAARRMPVYQCLVEACTRRFTTIEERKQHLVDLHRFPRNYHFDRLHLRRKKGQVRPPPQHQKKASKDITNAKNSDDSHHDNHPEDSGYDGSHSDSGNEASGGEAAMELAENITRLSVAAEKSKVPMDIKFGHRTGGRGLPGLGGGRNPTRRDGNQMDLA